MEKKTEETILFLVKIAVQLLEVIVNDLNLPDTIKFYRLLSQSSKIEYYGKKVEE